jgi:hypothetical protein
MDGFMDSSCFFIPLTGWINGWKAAFSIFSLKTAGYNREKLPAYFTNPWPLLKV